MRTISFGSSTIMKIEDCLRASLAEVVLMEACDSVCRRDDLLCVDGRVWCGGLRLPA